MKTNSAYSFGRLGYKTPTIDRIAKEGMTSARTPGRSIPGVAYTKILPEANIELTGIWQMKFDTEDPRLRRQ